jgi:monofunctional glycosyltransferase
MSSEPPRTSPQTPLRQTARTVLVVAIVLFILPYAIAPFYRVVDPVTTLMLWRRVTGNRVERVWVPIGRIAPVLPRSVIASEDDRFCSHHGIDFDELRTAVRAQMRGLRRPRGGSGITQQLAKNLFLWPGRSYVRKALELPLALWIDLVIPKRRQLEIYLNVVQWGPTGEFGAEAATRRAFGKPASGLSASEAAQLAATLPNPIRRDAKQPSAALRRLAGIVMARAAVRGDNDRCVRLQGHA